MGSRRTATAPSPTRSWTHAIQALDDDDAIEGIDRLFPEDAAKVISALQLDVIETEGDDAQLLAGATLAAFQAPSAESFRWINRRLAFALNRSHHYDPIMGQTDLHRMFDSQPDLSSLPPREQLKDPLEEAPKTGAALRPGQQDTPVPTPSAPSSEPTPKPASRAGSSFGRRPDSGFVRRGTNPPYFKASVSSRRQMLHRLKNCMTLVPARTGKNRNFLATFDCWCSILHDACHDFLIVMVDARRLTAFHDAVNLPRRSAQRRRNHVSSSTSRRRDLPLDLGRAGLGSPVRADGLTIAVTEAGGAAIEILDNGPLDSDPSNGAITVIAEA